MPHAPALRSFFPVLIDEIFIHQIKFGKDNDKTTLLGYKFFDPRVVYDKAVDGVKLKIFKSKLLDCLPKSGLFGYNGSSEEGDSDTLTPNQFSSSALLCPSLLESMSFNECYDIASTHFKEMMEIYYSKLFV